MNGRMTDWRIDEDGDAEIDVSIDYEDGCIYLTREEIEEMLAKMSARDA